MKNFTLKFGIVMKSKDISKRIVEKLKRDWRKSIYNIYYMNL